MQRNLMKLELDVRLKQHNVQRNRELKASIMTKQRQVAREREERIMGLKN